MVHSRHISALGACWMILGAWLGAASARAQAGGGHEAAMTGKPAPTPEQIHSLIRGAIENQHKDDRALEEFERVEHRIERKGENAEIVTDITQRLVPSGTG